MSDKDITDEAMDDWIERNVDSENAEDLLDGIDGNDSDEFDIVEDGDTDGTTISPKEEPEDPIHLPTPEALKRFRERVEKKLSNDDRTLEDALRDPKS